MKKENAFTLIELMVVIGILSIICAFTVPSLLKSRITANELSATMSCKEITEFPPKADQSGVEAL